MPVLDKLRGHHCLLLEVLVHYSDYMEIRH